MNEMLLGGIRVSNLIQPAPELEITKSENCKIPTAHQERRDLDIDFATFHDHLVPVNLEPDQKRDAGITRGQDVYRRFREQAASPTLPPPSELTIEPRQKLREGQRFMPFQILKPLDTIWRNQEHHAKYKMNDPGRMLHWETAGEKASYGGRRQQPSMWQQDTNTKSRIDYFRRSY